MAKIKETEIKRINTPERAKNGKLYVEGEPGEYDVGQIVHVATKFDTAGMSEEAKAEFSKRLTSRKRKVELLEEQAKPTPVYFKIEGAGDEFSDGQEKCQRFYGDYA